jgi:hypothetical protein
MCWRARHRRVSGEGLKAGLLDLGTLQVVLRFAWDSFVRKIKGIESIAAAANVLPCLAH